MKGFETAAFEVNEEMKNRGHIINGSESDTTDSDEDQRTIDEKIEDGKKIMEKMKGKSRWFLFIFYFS
jgi:hypothetical protein